MLLRLAEDNFDAYADNASLVAVAPNWTLLGGGIGVASGAVYPNSGWRSCAYWNACAFTEDHYSEGLVTALALANAMGLAVRAQSGVASYYSCLVSGSHVEVAKVIAGVEVSEELKVEFLSNVAPFMLRFEAIGNTLSVYKDDVAILATTDAALTGGAPGLSSNLAGPPNALIADWSGGEIGTGVEGNQEAPNTRVRARHGGR